MTTSTPRPTTTARDAATAHPTTASATGRPVKGGPVTEAPQHRPGEPSLWPDVNRLPPVSAARTAVARTLLRRAFGRMPLSLRSETSPWIGAPLRSDVDALGGGQPSLVLHDPDAFHRRIGADGLIGFGESYMAGEWDSDDLVAALTVLASHVDALVPAPLAELRRAWIRRRPHAHRNTPVGARRNIQRHYDLSNELFELFLDPTMTYSSALFTVFPARQESLEDAQHRKIDRLLDLASVGPGTRLLEIGTGWGELALRAAARGADVVTITLSTEQCDLARSRVAAAGHTDRVSVELCDYRDVQGQYDAIVSVEMIEAVGAEYWPAYFDTLRTALAPGGRIALQAITMAHDRMLATAQSHTWISKYIFPGGLIPSREAIRTEAARAGLCVTADHGYGEHYAETLRLWRERFTSHAARVTELGFDHVFQRMWELYLAYSEAGFRSRYLDVRHVLLTAADEGRGPGPL
ncbi:cyclopropane-fatty-acyl-phospholipid synthase family protein [Streptomyces sp. NPDC051577]|uniref:cyclopropane-fatty-acyl-phospholipid synthase family protein n=1 Tax=Streptomyces sp. NPDC051577 TaxID=3155166 RepID=UPI00342B8F16